MSGAQIEPGMWVECIRMDGEGCGVHWRDTPLPRVGGVYQVEDVIDGSYFEDGIGALTLFEFPGHYPDGQRLAYCQSRFRPIWRGDKSLIATLLEPLPDTVRQVEERV